jgi:hypothetical protein
MPGNLLKLACGAQFGFIRLSNLISLGCSILPALETTKQTDMKTAALKAKQNAND